MNFISIHALIWGVIFLFLGFSILVKAFTNIDIPVFRIILALFLFYLGLSVLSGGFHLFKIFKHGHVDGHTVVFSDTKFEYKDNFSEYNTVFGSGDMDLSTIPLENGSKHIQLNTVFGSSRILFDENTPAKIKATAVFGGAQFPDETTIAFGERVFYTPSYDESRPHITVVAHVVFGGLNIIKK